MSAYRYKTINRLLGKALHRYDMISDGDRIAVGLSGGKDSMTLLWFLNERLARIPIKYELFPIYIDPGFKGSFGKELEKYCRENGYTLKIEYTDHGIVAHSEKNRENPCFLCSRLRRKRLFEIADQLGCKKLALGHNKDDIIETLFLNMFYSGELSTMKPCQPFFNGKFTLIRPLSFVDESMIKAFTKDRSIPVFHTACPSSTSSKRHEIKTMLNQVYRNNRKVKGNIFRAIRHIKPDYLFQ